MATLSENAGNYTLAVKYTSLRYNYTGDVYDLARCVDDSLLSGKDKYISQYGEKLIDDENFGEVCEWKNTYLNGYDYKQYLGGKVACAVYNLGDFDAAFGLARDMVGDGGFANGNAVVALCVQVYGAQDAENADRLISYLSSLTPADGDEEELISTLILCLNF